MSHNKIQRLFYRVGAVFAVTALSVSFLFGGRVFALNPTPTAENCFTFDSSTGTITAYDDTTCTKDVVIPNTIGGVSVLNIDDSTDLNGDSKAPFEASGMNSVVFPSTLVSIGNDVFKNNNLTNLVLPDSLTHLQAYTPFVNNPLVTVQIGSPEYSGTPQLSLDGVFGNIATLRSVVIGNSVVTIQYSSFDNSPITSLDLGKAVKNIQYGTFNNNKLTSLVIPNSVEVLGGSAFSSNSELTSLTISTKDYTGAPVLELSGDSFSSVPKLTSLHLGNNVKAVKYGEFSNIPLKSLDLGESIQVITSGPFANTALTEVTFPASLTDLSSGAFLSTPTLTKLTFLGDTSVSSNAFLGDGLKELYLNGDVAIDATVLSIIDSSVGITGEYVRIYAPQTSSWWGAADEPGVYIVNPAQVNVRYTDTNGNDIAPSLQKLSDTLTDYTVSANPSADFSLYYRVGNTFTQAPIAIAGYLTPAAQQLTLGISTNNLSYVYQRVLPPSTGLKQSNVVVYVGVGIVGFVLIMVGILQSGRLSKGRA
ncbi:MAG: leucine-rich repeat domain-containing protein [Candidatus Saccharimonadaceae bacterium]